MADSAYTQAQKWVNYIKKGATGAVDALVSPVVNSVKAPFQTASMIYNANRATANANDSLQKQMEIANQQRYGGASPQYYNSMMGMANQSRNNFSGYNQGNYTEKSIKQMAGNMALSGIGTILTAGGLKVPVASLGKAAAAGGAISGGIAAATGQDVPTAIGQGIGTAPMVAGFGSYAGKVGKMVQEEFPRTDVTKATKYVRDLQGRFAKEQGKFPQMDSYKFIQTRQKLINTINKLKRSNKSTKVAEKLLERLRVEFDKQHGYKYVNGYTF